MSRITTPPLAAYDRATARAIGKAYRYCYAHNDMHARHQSAVRSAYKAFYRIHPKANSTAVSIIVPAILAAIETEHPGWLTFGTRRRDPRIDHDAYMEMTELGYTWTDTQYAPADPMAVMKAQIEKEIRHREIIGP